MSKEYAFSRREFIQRTAAVGAAMAAAGLLGVSPTLAAPSVPEKWDKAADVVIIGAGGTGLVAAIEALEAGASVLLLDKLGVAGGTTAVSGGVIQASSTKYQKAVGVQNDSPEAHYQYWMAASEGIADPDLVRVLSDNAPANIDWLVAHGLNYVNVYGVDPIPYIDPKLMVARIHVPGGAGESAKPGTGVFHIQALNDSATKKGAQFLFKTPATGLVRDPAKGVIGVMAQADGKAIAVKANKAVILAASSFDFNKDMARAFSPQQYWALTKGICLCSPAATGDGIRMALDIGADLAGMGGTIGVPSVGIGVAADMSTDGKAVPGIWVNKYGQRFVNEAGHYAYVTRAVFDQEEHIAWAVFDENVKKLGGKAMGGVFGAWSDDLAKEIASGVVKTGATLKDLAAVIGVNGAQLEATVTAWNKDAATGKDTLFGKRDGVKPLDKAPYYATAVTEVNLGAIGGVKINTKAQVLDLFGKVIPRLYAGGMNAGGFIGPYYPGSGTAIAATVCFGRLAGKNAAAEKPWGAV
jgi:urocanate reductase